MHYFATMTLFSSYCCSLYEIYPGRAPANVSDLALIQKHLPELEAGTGRSASVQAGYQMAALVTTLLFASVSGGITG